MRLTDTSDKELRSQIYSRFTKFLQTLRALLWLLSTIVALRSTYRLTGQLADTPTRGLPTRGQVTDWTTRGCHRRLCMLSFRFFWLLIDVFLRAYWNITLVIRFCPHSLIMQLKNKYASARCPVRELAIRELAYPRLAACPMSDLERVHRLPVSATHSSYLNTRLLHSARRRTVPTWFSWLRNLKRNAAAASTYRTKRQNVDDLRRRTYAGQHIQQIIDAADHEQVHVSPRRRSGQRWVFWIVIIPLYGSMGILSLLCFCLFVGYGFLSGGKR